MTTTPADFCQGHGTTIDVHASIPFDPEVGYLFEDDTDYGVVSYCDGTCTSARREWALDVRRTTGHYPVGDTITLEVTGTGDESGVSYRATFATQAQALAYIAAHRSRIFAEVEDALLPAGLDALAAVLYPQCEHLMSLANCYGPDHFPTRDQEEAFGF